MRIATASTLALLLGSSMYLAACTAESHSDAAEAPDGGGDPVDPTPEAGSPGPDGGPGEDASDAVRRDAAARADAGADQDAAPPGTVTVTGLGEYLFQIANGGADHCASAGGHDLCGGSCNGKCAGTSAESSYSIQTGIASPSVDGPSTRVDVTGAGTDTLEWVKVDPAAMGEGAYANATHFRWSLAFYPTALTDVQAYEFDLFYGSNGWWLMMGSQCDLATGNWNGWDQATGHWMPSSITGCGAFFHPNAWNQIVLTFHRDPGATGASTHYYYDGLEVNGEPHTWGLGGFTGTDPQWGDVVGVQVQQDLTSAFSGTLSSYYDDLTLEISP